MILPAVDASFAWHATPAGPALVCRALQPFATHVFTTRAWALGSRASNGAAPEAWGEVAAQLGVAAGLYRLRQVHGNRTVRAAMPTPATLAEADIAITDELAIGVAVQAADCVPLLLVDRRSGAVAAAHAGWRGMAARVPRSVVAAMHAAFSTRAEDLIAALGPSIGACCYEVGADVYDAFAGEGFGTTDLERWFSREPQPSPANPSMPLPPRRTDRWFFDGWASVTSQLEAEGIPRAQIFRAGLCTASHPDLLPSYRREGRAAGRIAAAITPRRP
jgi:purine-nucleoside/S-methyl-5'-thioadenosine phosphorylase / adenosine deaminase